MQWSTGSSVEETESESWTDTGSRCTFVPPAKARNFSITAVGGGGGGAGARSETEYWESDFPVEYYGKYKFLAVGGGGEGGDSQCDKVAAGGGGGGGIGYGEYELDESVKLVRLERGLGGTGGDYGGISGTASTITLVKDVKSELLINAEGGEGGHGKWRGFAWACNRDSSVRGKGGSVSTEVKGFNITKIPGKDGKDSHSNYCGGCVSFNDAKKINNFIGKAVMQTEFANQEKQGSHTFNGCSKFQKGRGGDGEDSIANITWTFPRSGGHGLAMATTKIMHSGRGGKASVPDDRFVPAFKERKINVTVGKGGRGGKNGGIGSRGGDTTVTGATTNTSYAKSFGADGGTVNYIEKAGISTPGEDGGKSLMYYNAIPAAGYGGLSGSNSSVDGKSTDGAGGGGGGGGATEDGDAGDGADGAPGYVIIEW